MHLRLQAAEYGEAPETESKNFAKIALPEILPTLLALLTRQDEDAEEDEWEPERIPFSVPGSPKYKTGLATPGDIGTLTEEVST